MQVGRRCLAIAGAVVAITASITALGAGTASATPTTFTWTGGAANANWSSADNWSGGVAPTVADGPVDLVFPATSAGGCVAQCLPIDDIDGLDVSAIDIEASYGFENPTGQTTTMNLSGGVTVGPGAGRVGFNPTIALTDAQNWDLQDGFVPMLVTGTSALDVSVGDGGSLTLDTSINIGPVTITGQDSADTGANAATNGGLSLFPTVGAGLNGQDGEPVTVVDAVVSGTGAIGPLTLTGAQIAPGSSYQSDTTAETGLVTSSTSAAAFDANTQLLSDHSNTCPATTAPCDAYSTSGALNLGSATLDLLDACTTDTGTTVELLHAGGGFTGTLRGSNGDPITNGSLIYAGVPTVDSGECPANPYIPWKISIDATDITATIEPEPTTTTLTASPNPADIGQPVTFTATVTAGYGAAYGTVTFSDSAGPVCSNVQMEGGPVTCQLFGTSVSTIANTAVFTPSPGSTYAGSTSNTVDERYVAGPAADMTATPSSANLGDERVGDLGPPTTVTISNNGPGYELIRGLQFLGSDPNDFLGLSNCFSDDAVGDLSPGQSCTVEVGLAPTTDGPRRASLQLVDNQNNPLQVPLTGTGTEGYYEVTSTGRVLAFGDALNYGDLSSSSLKAPIVGIATTPDGDGYWLVAADGGVFSFGDANFYGSTGALHLNKPIVGMASTPDGSGYWLVASDGGIFSFGDADFYGSTGALHLNKPIVGMASTPDGGGYWLVASDGGIFGFGVADFYGSTGDMTLNKPIVGMASTPDGSGYWLVASDGGIFSFGDADFYGSTGALHLNKPIVGMAPAPDGNGYWFTAADGGIFTFGSAAYSGSGASAAVENVVAMAGTAPPTADSYLGVGADSGNERVFSAAALTPAVRVADAHALVHSRPAAADNPEQAIA